MLQSLWLWTAPLLAEMKSFAQRKFGWRDRIPRTRLISPTRLRGLPSNATATRIRYLVLFEIYGKISFYSLRTLYPDKDRYCVLLGISPYFRVFFLNQDFAVADTSRTWKQILADSIQGEYTRAVWCLAIWSSFFEKTLRPMLIWPSQLLVSKCHGYGAQVIEAEYGNQGLQ